MAASSSIINAILPGSNLITDSRSPVKIRKQRRPLRRSANVDTTQAQTNTDVLRKCIQQLGWKECVSGSSADIDIYWNAGSFQDGNRNLSLTTARVNKFPGMCDILQKANLTRSLNVTRTLFPEEYDFYPRTWLLPEQNEQFQKDACAIQEEDRRRHRPPTIFIVKPSEGSEGAGIYLIRDPNRCNVTNRLHVVQEYIHNPLLIDGLKFDLRIYVLIHQLDPLEIFLYDEGLARFATVTYQAPSSANLHQTFMHLTNYSLNKRSATYRHGSDENQVNASKRKMTLVWQQLAQHYNANEIDQTKLLIIEMINKTVLAILPEIRIQYTLEFSTTRKQNRCFQIIGFDVLLTDQLKPILLEVNANPSLRIDFDHTNEAGKFVREPSVIDEEIKKPLILETLRLVIAYRDRTTVNSDDDKNIDQSSYTSKNSFNMKQQRPKSKISQSRQRLDDDSQKLHVTQTSTETSIIDEEQQQLKAANENPIDEEYHSKLRDDDTSSDSHEDSPSLENMLDSSINKSSTIVNSRANNLVKSLTLIFPSVDHNKYEQMFLLEKIAFIYIELVTRRGYKFMTNRQFRNFANLCNVLDEMITMHSIDMLYTQIFRKWKQNTSSSAISGLHFPAFIEAFFILSQRKSFSDSLVNCTAELVNCCMHSLDMPSEQST